jgi:hypothetical protein
MGETGPRSQDEYKKEELQKIKREQEEQKKQQDTRKAETNQGDSKYQ